MRLGVICPSEIAFRRFMPALQQCDEISFAGIGVFRKEELMSSDKIGNDLFNDLVRKEKEKAQSFIDQYGGRIFDGYETIATSPEIDALYIPLPPALHYKWAKTALKHGKHVLVEKPSTTSAVQTKYLIETARNRGLALHENYMFAFHEQLNKINEIVKSDKLGDVRLYRICFGFPKRAKNDFRYNKELGGGALIDAGGYTIRYASMLLGPTAAICYAQSNYVDGYEVDIYGSAAMTNEDGVTAQIAFGMDNDYKCELEIWGSKGCLSTNRVLTAPAGFTPTATIRNGNETTNIELPADDTFLKSINHFLACVRDEKTRNERYSIIVKQALLIDEFKRLSKWK